MDADLTIVLLGNTGVGKSAAGNTILGQTAFPSKASFKPVTKQISEVTGEVFGKVIRVIDTPGILESEQQVKNRCQHVVESSRPHLFLLVLSVRRFGADDQKSVETVLRLLTADSLKNSFLLFTGGDALNDMELDEFLREDVEGSLQNVVQKFEGRHHLFNNQQGGQAQAEELLQKFFQPAIPVEPIHQEERRIILIGRPGGGKSSAGNTILGSETFKTDCDFNLVSTLTVSETAEVEGRQLTVVDTPGFTDEVLTPKQLYREIMKSVVEASPGPHAFVIVVRIGKVSEADIKLFKMLQIMFGSDSSQYTMVLFTHGGELRGHSMDSKIRSNSFVTDLVSMCGGRFCVFENTKRGNRRQAREFLKKIDEMVKSNKGEHYTSDMFRMAETVSEHFNDLFNADFRTEKKCSDAVPLQDL